ncbi:ABC transporter permease [Paenibacillus sp. sgz302251]|uniref:ABC transporter permease n=1 Tax=Paenibacillus sp. sgz302251 TaxID=3414493 RepID=UPI003C7B1B1C
MEDAQNVAGTVLGNITLKKAKKRSGKTSPLIKILPVLSFFAIWELISRTNEKIEMFNPIFLPAPTVILQEALALAQSGILIESIISSTTRMVIGFVIGCLIAVTLAVFMSRIAVLELWIGQVINLTTPVPAIAILPMIIIWFGIGEFPKILLIVWTTFAPVLAYTLDGLKNVNPLLIRSAKSLGASERQIFFRVTWPSAVPFIFVGAQVSLGLAFSSLIVAEMMGASSGLGYIIVDARNYFRLSSMFVAIVVIGLEYSLLSLLLKLLERRFVAWRQNGVRSAIEK